MNKNLYIFVPSVFFLSPWLRLPLSATVVGGRFQAIFVGGFPVNRQTERGRVGYDDCIRPENYSFGCAGMEVGRCLSAIPCFGD
ncbi:hypothetical protein M8C21_002156 [Ambrosia artemisiifolia]|uniref:Secreted protein n=1 Tax=Ambrosia artemisiifolia TaxID=4212 RepID=A0AAD5BNZ1_AMBAR|nr:hypothetical protein M8C21_002156 [Ambrosia artemisiifolia]